MKKNKPKQVVVKEDNNEKLNYSFLNVMELKEENYYVLILDKLYDDIKEGKIVIDNAIYIVKEEDFEKITKMSKIQAIGFIDSRIVDARRVFHSGAYKDRYK